MRSWTFVGLLLVFPSSLAAQNRWSVAPYLGANLSMPGDPALTGVAVGYSAGVFGVRGGFAIEPLWSDVPASSPGAGAFTADVDLRVAWTTTEGYVPSLFGGVGVEGARADGDMRVLPTYGGGAGLGYELFRWARVESEARYRVPFGGSVEPGDAFARGWEFRVGLAVAWSAGGGSPRAAPPVVVARDPARWPDPRTPAELDIVAGRILDTAEDYLGTRYLWGGSAPATGFDCSGFLQYVFRSQGLHLPRTSRQMAQVGAPLAHATSAWEPGDLLFFASNGRTIDHVAMYAGGGRIIHSTDSGGGVRYDVLASNRGNWFTNHLVAARRVLDDGALLSPFSIGIDGSYDPPDKAPRIVR
jgi:cell wall-associated NlpC family hydrolase